MNWQTIKKAINTYGPYVLKFILDRIVDLIIFLKKQVILAIQQVFKM